MHIAIVLDYFRNKGVTFQIYLADYLPQNRKELVQWREEKSDFDWSVPLKMILTQEGNSWDDLDEMIALTRKKVCLSFNYHVFIHSAMENASIVVQ